MTMVVSVVKSTSPPSVDIGITGLPAQTTKVVITRQWGSGVGEQIRGAVGVAGTTAHAIDYDVPVDFDVTYKIQAITGRTLVLETAVTPPVRVDPPPVGVAWLTDPMAPRGSMLVSLLLDSDHVRKYVAPTSAVVRLGSQLPAALSGTRQAPLRVIGWGTDTLEEAEAAEVLISSGGVLLVRCSQATMPHATGLLYVGAPVVERVLYWPAAFADWVIGDGFEARGPAAPAVVHLWMYSDQVANGGTYQTLKGSFVGKTYLDMARSGG